MTTNCQFHSVTLHISRTVESRIFIHMCKIMISPGTFLCFLKKYNILSIKILTFLLVHFNNFYNKQLFFKFINKCQKEILKRAPPSSHAVLQELQHGFVKDMTAQYSVITVSSYHGHTRFRINPHSTEYQGTPCLKPG